MFKCARKKKMSIHIWKYFTMFSIIIMATLWLLQIIFFNAYYETMKIKELTEIGNDVIRHYNDEDFDSYVEKLSFIQGVSIGVFDGEGNVLLDTNNHDFKNEDIPMNPSPFNPDVSENELEKTDVFKGNKALEEREHQDINQVIDRFGNHKGNSLTYIERHKRFGRMITYATRIPNGDGYVYAYVKSALPSSDYTIDILRTQLVMVTLLSLAISFVLSYFFARRLTKPIENITKSAKRLADGDYSVEFDGGDYYELDQLGNVLNTATEEIGKTEALRNDLMANVSHDLRTPLTIIKSYAEMIRDLSGDNPKKREQHTNVIIKETDRLSALVTDMLDLSKFDAGTHPKVFKEFSLSESVKSAMLSFQVMTETDGYTIKSDIEEGCIINGDEKMISQAIYNLVSNAINYTGEDKSVSVKLYKTEGSKVRFEVTDTGKGIDDSEKEFVWDRYYKSSRTHTREVEGSGLGLSIVKNIFEIHKASYGVDSRVGSGSTFWFEIDSI